jgi:thiamine-triphosphatase
MPANLSRRCTLEVERKFRSLAVKSLVSNDTTPRFRSIQQQKQQFIRDSYYDRSNLLTSAGIWVRKRNGRWEAKVKQGGSFNNSKFVELTELRDVSECVSRALKEDV